MDMDLLSSVLTSLLLLVSITFVVKLLNWVWFRPKRLEKFLRKQGLNGNPYRLLVGDMSDLIRIRKSEQSKSIKFSDNLASHIMPYYQQTIHKFGQNPFIWFGPSPRLNITDPQNIKEILSKPDLFHKPPDSIRETIAGGLSSLEDEKWTKHRKIINPAFHLHKLKNMTMAIRLSCSNMIDEWETLVSRRDQNSKEIDVWPYFEDLTGDLIARIGFGNSYENGRRLLELQKEQFKLVLQLLQFYYIPGWRYIPTKSNKRMKTISKEMESLLKGVINQREKEMERGEAIINDDLLGILMESNLKEIQQHGNKDMGMSIEDVIEECKLFYFAGYETTSSLLVWTTVMLSVHQEWQTRAREEVLQFFGEKEPTFDGLNRLKVVTMILQEVLRLYTPAPIISRTPTKEVKVGNLTLPVGAHLMLLIGLLHHDPKIWGEDVNEFKPERFSEGISNATKVQFSFIPFSSGPRICIGQHFAMIGVKMALTMILQRFLFELSPSYLHAPFSVLILEPKYGAPLLFHKF